MHYDVIEKEPNWFALIDQEGRELQTLHDREHLEALARTLSD